MLRTQLQGSGGLPEGGLTHSGHPPPTQTDPPALEPLGQEENDYPSHTRRRKAENSGAPGPLVGTNNQSSNNNDASRECGVSLGLTPFEVGPASSPCTG